MTLILKLDLDMVNIYLHEKNVVPILSGSKGYSLNRQTDRWMGRQTDIPEINQLQQVCQPPPPPPIKWCILLRSLTKPSSDPRF